MSNRFYNPKNQSGKALVPVATQKSLTDAGADDYIDISWLDTHDTLTKPNKKRVLSSDILVPAHKEVNRRIGAAKEEVLSLAKEQLEKLAEDISKEIENIKFDITDEVAENDNRAVSSNAVYQFGNKLKNSIDNKILEIVTKEYEIVNGETTPHKFPKNIAFVSFKIDGDIDFIPEIVKSADLTKFMVYDPNNTPEGFNSDDLPKSLTVTYIILAKDKS